MKKTIKKVLSDFRKGRNNRYFNKVGWLSLEDRVYQNFEKLLAELGEDKNVFGGLYISSTRDKEEFKKSKRTRVEVINSIHIWTGHRILGALEVGNYTKAVSENNAQLVFSQGPHGGITIFLYPYKSDIHEVIEKNIALGYYEDTSQLNDKEIKKILIYYLKYCFASSLDGLSYKPLKNHIFRKFLLFKDFRNRVTYRVKIFNFFERLLILLFGLGAILATVWSVYYVVK